jgi:hypothetical protein
MATFRNRECRFDTCRNWPRSRERRGGSMVRVFTVYESPDAAP